MCSKNISVWILQKNIQMNNLIENNLYQQKRKKNDQQPDF